MSRGAPFTRRLYRSVRRAARVISMAAVIALLGCPSQVREAASDEDSATAVKSPMIEALAEIPGRFERAPDSGAWTYSHAVEIEATLSDREPHSSLEELVACLDDRRPSASVLRGDRVAVGIVCYQALRQTAYFEPTDADGDIGPDWPGDIPPDALLEDLLVAQQAWRAVLERRSYILL